MTTFARVDEARLNGGLAQYVRELRRLRDEGLPVESAREAALLSAVTWLGGDPVEARSTLESFLGQRRIRFHGDC